LIIRYGGGNKGIKEYLEEGRKVDRHLSRDELDRRVPIEGDLTVTQAVIDSIADNGQERYLHISLSFNEPDVQEDEIKEVFRQYREQLMSAYGEDEYNIYAEIHWPKVKESYNHKTQAMEPRFPHVHVVIPKKNTLTGKFLNPVGMHEASVKYLDAIQEKLNRDNRLSSPRLSPRNVGVNHYAAALDRYKATEFSSKNAEVKKEIHAAIIERDIRSFDDFKKMVEEYGEVKVRNAGKGTEYLAVRVGDDKKFTNLKANIFSKSYLADRSLVIDPITDAQVSKRIESWNSIQSREIKYISNASAKVKAHYRDLSLPDRRTYLDERERSYGERYRPERQQAGRGRAAELPGIGAGDYGSSNSEFGREGPATAGNMHELSKSNVDHFAAKGSKSVGLFLLGNEANDLHDLESDENIRLRGALYAGGGGSRESRAGRVVPALPTDPQSSVLTSLLHAEHDKALQANDLEQFKEIRRNLDAQHLLAYAQLKFGVDPALHPVTKAKDGSARIKVGKYNYNVSDFLTKHIGLEWGEASNLLRDLYEKQQAGITEKPRSKVVLLAEWRRFREEIYPQNIRTYDDLKNEIKISFGLGLKAINAEYFARRKNITLDQTLSRTDKHYFRSIVILEKLQKVESLQQRIDEQNSLRNRVKYPYSTLFYDYATKNEAISMDILDRLKRKHVAPVEDGVNSIGGKRPMTPHQLPNGAEAMKRARLVAKLHSQEREARELRIKLSDLRPRPQADGSVVFSHKEHGKQIFVNHPDRVELNRQTDPDEVGVGLMYSIERFGNPLEISGSNEFKRQIVEVAAERDMDITFTDEALNQALTAKRLELGLDPLPGNTISVEMPELDSSLPLREAVDKALLESKVAELDAVNNDLPYSMIDTATHQGILEDALSRHDEISAGFVSDDQVREYAALDVEAFTGLNNTPEQQQLALSMEAAASNDTYRAFLADNTPTEFQLTVDAARFIQARPVVAAPDQASAPQAAAAVSPVLVAHGAAPYLNKPDNKASYFVTTQDSGGVENTRWGVDLERAIAESGAAVGDRVELRNLGQTNVEIQVPIYDDNRNVVGERTETAKRNTWNVEVVDRQIDVQSETVAQPVEVDAEPVTRFIRPDFATALEEKDQLEQPAVNREPTEFADWTDAASTAARLHADFEIEPRSDEYSRNVAAVGIEASQFMASAEGGQEEFYGADKAYHEAALVDDMGRLAATHEAYRTYVQNYAPTQLQIRIDAAQPAPAAEQPAAGIESLNFTHNGQPAEIDLSRYPGQPASVEPAAPVIEQPAAAGIEPLNFTNNGEPAEIDLSRYPGQPASVEPAAPVIEQPAAAGIEPLNFTHNGQPAEIDLSRYPSQPTQAVEQPQAEAQSPMREQPAAVPQPIQLDPASRETLEAEWNALQQQAMQERNQNHQVVKERMIQALEARKQDLGAEAKALNKSLPLSERMLNMAFGNPDSMDHRQRISGINHAIRELKTDKMVEIYAPVSTTLERERQYDERFVVRTGKAMSGAEGELALDRDDWVKQQAAQRMTASGLAPALERVTPSAEAVAVANANRDKVIDRFVDHVAETPWPIHRQSLAPLAISTIENASLEARHAPVIEALKQYEPALQPNHSEADVKAVTSIDVRAEVVAELTAAERAAELTAPVVQNWVSADRTDYYVIQSQDLREVAEGTIGGNTELVPAYDQELKITDPALSEKVAEPSELEKQARQLRYEVEFQDGQIKGAERQLQSNQDELARATHQGREPEYLAKVQHDIDRGQAFIAGSTELKANAEQALAQSVESPALQARPELADRAADLRAINAAFAADSAPDTYDEIVRRGTLADVYNRHEEIATMEAFGNSDGLQEMARKDLEAYRRLEGTPEQQNVALAMGRAMDNQDYSEYVAVHAPSDFAVTVEAAQVVSAEQQTKAPAGLSQSEPDMDV
jgi:hypothetical protein